MASFPQSRRAAVATYVAGLGMARAGEQRNRRAAGASPENGRVDDMVRILTDPSHDGWANILAQGATYTWEVWEPSDADGDSMSHGWGSNVLVEIQQTLLGVRPTSPGYAIVRCGAAAVRPRLGGRDGAHAREEPSTWPGDDRRRPAAEFVLDVTVPPNASATVHLPAASAHGVTEGGRSLHGAAGIRQVSARHGEVVVAVGAGHFEFTRRSGPVAASGPIGPSGRMGP